MLILFGLKRENSVLHAKKMILVHLKIFVHKSVNIPV